MSLFQIQWHTYFHGSMSPDFSKTEKVYVDISYCTCLIAEKQIEINYLCSNRDMISVTKNNMCIITDLLFWKHWRNIALNKMAACTGNRKRQSQQCYNTAVTVKSNTIMFISTLFGDIFEWFLSYSFQSAIKCLSLHRSFNCRAVSRL